MKRIAQLIFAALALWNFQSAGEVALFPEFKTASIGGGSGSFVATNGAYDISSSTTNGSFFAFQQFTGNGQIIARIRRTQGQPKIGLEFRESLATNSTRAGIFLVDSNTVFERITDPKQPVAQTKTNAAEWLRIVREGDALSGFFSSDGTNWIQFSADTVEMPATVLAGCLVSGIGQARFEKARMTSARLSGPRQNSSFVVPTNIAVNAEISNLAGAVKHVDFFAGTERIGGRDQFPFSILWTNALAGAHEITAKLTANDGAEFFTEPVSCEVKLPSSEINFVGIDDSTAGDWKGNYGDEGFLLVRHATNLPPYALVTASGNRTIFLTYSNERKAPQLTNGSGRISAHWFTDTNMIINVGLLDGNRHQVAIYFFDGDNNFRVQTIEAIDPSSNRVVDSHRAKEFGNGNYFIWDIRGAVKFRITALSGNAVVSGIFFDASRSKNSLKPSSN